jgi:hypothetical protein
LSCLARAGFQQYRAHASDRQVSSALRAQDFDVIALTADCCIETQGDLRGIVIHARKFSDWENRASVLRHMRFIRNHQSGAWHCW